MYPSSASSSSQGSTGLTRYGSAPSSVISNAVDSVIGSTRDFPPLETQTHTRLFETNSESTSATAMANHNRDDTNTTIGLQPPFRFSGGGEGGGSSSLIRHSSSPAGFLNQLAAAAGDVNGFSITRGIGSYNSKESRLNSSSHLSFTGKESLSRISEENTPHHQDMHKKLTHSYPTASSFGIGPSWEHTSNPNPNPMMFSVAPPNRPKNNLVDSLHDNMHESQFQFSISQTAQDMASMEKLMNIPQDSVTCKIRAKRGCATHPRSIAERERRTRISGKLKKLQDLVPNMDKQTSYADMLDLAVQHIVCLQDQVQKLNKGLDSCTCGCKKTSDS